jgi:hypothetical protein
LFFAKRAINISKANGKQHPNQKIKPKNTEEINYQYLVKGDTYG